MNITANPFQTPTAIYGPSNACSFINSSNTATYYVNKVARAPQYIWTVPQGVTIVGNPGGIGENDTIIEVTYDASFVSGTLIQVQTAGCNNSLPRSLTILKNGQSSPLPIAGITGICSQIPNETPVTFTTGSVENVFAYVWTTPTGATITTGQGDTSIQVIFDSSFNGGNISVQTSNYCGLSLPMNLLVNKLSPTAARSISGSTAIYLCTPLATNEYMYTALGAIRAESYTWSVPANVNITSRNTTDSSITVAVDTNFVQGSIAVSSVNACGVSTERSIIITKKLPSTPSAIQGTTNVCSVVGTGNTISYSTPSVANTLSYVWTVPAGAAIVSGQGDTVIQVAFDSTFNNGPIKVQTMGYCGLNPAQRALALVTNNVAMPTSIDGPTNACAYYANEYSRINFNNILNKFVGCYGASSVSLNEFYF
jgi:hypothetical protein